MDEFYVRLPHATPDDLIAPEVGEWSLQKNTRLWNYLGIFTTGMKNAHNKRVYVDLFAGAGIRGTDLWLKAIRYGSPQISWAVASRRRERSGTAFRPRCGRAKFARPPSGFARPTA